MCIRKLLAIYFIFFDGSLLTQAIAAEFNELLPIRHTNFTALKENPLATDIMGLVSQVGQLSVDGFI